MAEGPLDAAVDEARKALLAGSPRADQFVPLLLDAAEIVRQLHREDRLYLTASDEDHPDACPHDVDSDHDEYFEGDDGEWYCTSRPAGRECRCGAEWPCGEYVDVLAVLTGQWGDREALARKLTTEADGG